MTGRRGFLAIGECMIEMSGGDDGLWRLGYAGDTFNAAWCVRALLDPREWDVSYLTRVGRDSMSDRMVAFMEANGIGAAMFRAIPNGPPAST